MVVLTKRGASRQVVADTSSEIELFAINNDSSVPDAIDLFPDHLSRELRGKPTRKIVHVQHNEESHSFNYIF